MMVQAPGRMSVTVNTFINVTLCSKCYIRRAIHAILVEYLSEIRAKAIQKNYMWAAQICVPFQIQQSNLYLRKKKQE